ncbi:phage tail tape measure protein [Streptomyces sp. SS7]|uniref:phage tail tape measure protein n=1 Tax=Streptomyces sp. SS7 TaxID=3108485 RepID=UPI0030EEF119
MASDTSLIFRLIARDEASPELNAMQERLSTASAAIGAGVAGALGVGVAQAMDMSAANAKLQTQLGIGNAEAANLAKVSAHVYAGAWGESTADVNEAIRGVYQNIGDVSGVKGGLEGVTTKVMALSEAFDQDLGGTTAAVGQMLKTGLAKNANEALDIITVGFQKGVNKADDLLDTFNEYGVQFKSLGLDGQTAMGILSQGLKGGARDADLVADSLKEFNLRARDITSTAPAGFKALGLNAKQMAADVAAGGPRATAALQKTLDALRKYPDTSKKASVAANIFGTQSEDMQKALLKIDPSHAVDALGKVSGAADKAAKTLGSSPAKEMEKFKRAVTTQLAVAGSSIASFAMQHTGVVKGLAIALGAVAAVIVTVTAAQRVYATYTAIATAAETVRQSALYMSVAGYLRLMGVGLMAMARTAAAAVASAATTGAAWLGSALTSIAAWVAAVVRAAVTAVAQFALMAARAVIWAATMAAQWLIAMGPIGWIIAAVVALVVLIIANWDTVKKWTLKIWNWLWGHIKSIAAKVWNIFLNWTIAGLIIKHWDAIKSGTVRVWNATVSWVKGIPGKIVSFFLNWTLPGLIIKHWGRIKSGSIQVATSLVSWVKGLPGRISAGIGSLGSLLYSKGRSVVQGLWNGIKGMGGWLWNQVKSFAKSTIKGAIDNALSIFSPSKVTAAQGRWIAKGLVVGLMGSAKQVQAASKKLADIVRDNMRPGKARSKALDVIGSDTKKLVKLAGQREAINKRLKAAQTKLNDLVTAKAKIAADVKAGILQGADINSMIGDDLERGMGASNILAGLQAKTQQAQKFAALMSTLKKKGVRSDLIGQIAAAGVEGGMATAQALSTASASQVKAINNQQAALVKAAGSAGNATGAAMYDSGIKAAQGLVKGLKSQEKAIEKQMMKIAQHMKTAIKKSLGIKSPSSLMADEVGAFVPPGVWQGVKRKTPQLQSDLRRWAGDMVRPVREGAVMTGQGSTSAPLLGGSSSPQSARPLQANLIVDGRQLASVLIDHLRGEIQRLNGGNVQKALGRGTA